MNSNDTSSAEAGSSLYQLILMIGLACIFYIGCIREDKNPNADISRQDQQKLHDMASDSLLTSDLQKKGYSKKVSESIVRKQALAREWRRQGYSEEDIQTNLSQLD